MRKGDGRIVVQSDASSGNGRGSAAIRVGLLSGFEVVARGKALRFPASASRLIAYLALQQRPVSRPKLAGVLWPETTQERAQASLRSTLWRVRQVHEGIVRSANGCLTLADGVSVDVESIVRITDQLGAGEEPDGATIMPMTWFSYELLPDWHDDWVAFERERLRLMALHALEGLSAWYRSSGNYAMAIESAIAAVRLEPMRESSYRALVAAHVAQGNLSEAVRHYRVYRDLIQRELGVEPSHQMTDLLEAVGLTQVTGVA